MKPKFIPALIVFVIFILSDTLPLLSQNNSLHFDGVDDLVITNGNPLLELATGTVELWVKPELKSTSQTFVCYRNSTGSQTRYLWNFLGNLSGLGFWNGSAYHTIGYNFTPGQWYHIAFVGEDTYTTVFINGIQSGTFAISFGTASGNDLNLVLGNDIPLTEFFSGEIDEFRIWDTALCIEEINTYINCELAGDEPGLITYYNFNQGTAGGNNSSETTLEDASSNGLDGILNNFTLNGTASNWLASTNGVSGNCSIANCPPPYTVQVYYLIASGYSFVQAEYDEIARSMQEIQGWYQAQTGGKTFEILNPEDLVVVNLPNTSVYYNADYWGRIQADMLSLGYIPFNTERINVYFIKGGGGVALGAQACGVDCGLAMFGMDIYPQFNTEQYFTCPNAPGGAAAFPCTPLGAATHELGHCFGLPHPVDIPATSADANHSVMQTHWNYPYNYAAASESPWGLLTIERQTLLNNPFFFDDISLQQKNEDLPIVNLPSTGSAPTANFSYTISDKTVTFTNTSSGNNEDYWTFGDEKISHDPSPAYTYDDYGTYTVRLRVLNSSNGMMDIKEEVIDVSAVLPLDLIHFDVSQEKDRARLFWETENEIGVSKFDILKSYDGHNWFTAGAVEAKGKVRNEYELIDALDQASTVVYYRLKMTDFDGSFAWSPIRMLRLSDADKKILIYPNPTLSEGTLFISKQGVNQIVEIAIFNFTGKQLLTYPKHNFTDYATNTSLALPQLNAGTYLLKIEMNDGNNFFKKLVITD